MKKEEAEDLLKKYLAGNCTKREVEIVESWYQLLDKGKKDFLPERGQDIRRKRILENINRIIDKEQRGKGLDPLMVRENKMYGWNLRILSKIAAVLLIGFAISVLIYEKNKSEVTDSGWISTSDLRPNTIYLSDGSVVWIKGDSHLDYPEQFDGHYREVYLSGEAFFDIAEDANKPFIIQTANFTTSVLGTSFNIKAYENDSSQEVTVVSGKVLVSVKEDQEKIKELVLEPNQKAVFTPLDKSLVELEFKKDTALFRIAGSKMVFNETALGDIIKILNREHGVKISLENENLKNCLITADLTNEPLDICMQILSRTINSEYHKKDNIIVISGKGCQ